MIETPKLARWKEIFRKLVKAFWLSYLKSGSKGGADFGLYPRIHLVVASKHDHDNFWDKSLLSASLAKAQHNRLLTWHIEYSNSKGLPEVYNQALDSLDKSIDIIIFVHDDVEFTDSNWWVSVVEGLRRFDIIGVAGNTRRIPGQPAWLFRSIEGGQFIWDHPWLSGSIRHGSQSNAPEMIFGPAPRECELLDGVFLAVNMRAVKSERVRFDSRFAFHFYDMDFCRSAKANGLSLGTWPVALLHVSAGSFGSPSWLGMWAHYRAKWGE